MYSLSLWLALGAFGMALGCPWVDFGAHFDPFGLPLAPLGVPWGCLGGAQGKCLELVKEWTSNSEQMCLMYRAGAQNLASQNSQADPDNPAKVAYGPQLATPPSSRRGLG